MELATSDGESRRLASILVTCCGQLEFTRLCLPSIFRHTFLPYELIFLDIASLDGTAEVRQAGYTLACCADVFIHHFGSRSFGHGAPAASE